ncbi:MAG: pentapeptide repeat-containing protein [Candidatus Methylacidiphilales bacterium]
MEKYTTILTLEEFDKLATTTQDKSKRNLNFNNCIFNFEIELSENLNSVRFQNCIFKCKTKFASEFGINATFKNVQFKAPTTFANSKFNSKTRFHAVTFEKEVDFDNTKFADLADFWGSNFQKTTIFYKTDFLGVTVFSRTTFNENVLFTYSLIDKVIIFRGTIFKKGLDLSLAILNGNFNVFDIRLGDYSTEEISDEDEYEDSVSDNGIIPEKNKRETFKLLKTQLQSQGNKIDSLIYSNLEIETFHKQLSRQFWREKKIRSTFENYFILVLNSISSKNGRSWLQGIVFTLSIAGLFFYFAILTTDRYSFTFSFPNIEEINDCLKLYFEFLTPTHKVQFLEDLGTNPWTYLLDFAGRAFIAYGIYQTIQAFRKYRSA